MTSFRFSNDNNYHLDEALHQIEVLYPSHTKEEMIPLIQKVSAALGARDFNQARKIMINPTLPFYFKTDSSNNNYRNVQNNSNWKKKYDYNRNQSPPKKHQDFPQEKKP
eukprot:GHVP01043590.1.p1 GENE.GHVP01043590.1~~GHVP01043590.1.p1  ORF type:complete len:109 (-),score=13.23 GHVP01043590.1:261-587(-)